MAFGDHTFALSRQHGETRVEEQTPVAPFRVSNHQSRTYGHEDPTVSSLNLGPRSQTSRHITPGDLGCGTSTPLLPHLYPVVTDT